MSKTKKTTRKPTKTPPSDYLSDPIRDWMKGIQDEYNLESHHEKILLAAAQAWQQMIEALETVKNEGSFFEDWRGQPRVHPAVGVARDSRIAFLRSMRELGLDLEKPSDTRPPYISRQSYSD